MSTEEMTQAKFAQKLLEGAERPGLVHEKGVLDKLDEMSETDFRTFIFGELFYLSTRIGKLVDALRLGVLREPDGV